MGWEGAPKDCQNILHKVVFLFLCSTEVKYDIAYENEKTMFQQRLNAIKTPLSM